jgi:hypothetical protein
MKRHVFLVAAMAALVGGVAGVSCTTPQPAAECNFQTPYWAKYTLVDAGPTPGSCSTYEGDRVDFQRYSPPGATQPTFAFLPRRLGRITRYDPCSGGRDGAFFRVSTSPADDATCTGAQAGTDCHFQHESPLGTFAGDTPDSKGLCTSTGAIKQAEQTFPEVTVDECVAAGVPPYLDDGGVDPSLGLPYPPTHVIDAWSNFKLISTAHFNQNMWEADVTLTRDSCAATYHVLGVYPMVGCTTDEDCNPNANLAAGRPVGSGVPAEFKSTCAMFSSISTYEAKYVGALSAALGEESARYDSAGTALPLPGVCLPPADVNVDSLSALQ